MYPPTLPAQQQSPGSYAPIMGNKQAPPPTAPKPKPTERHSQQPQQHHQHPMQHPFRPAVTEEGNGYRDSPPPPPPPTHTHPLLQQSSSVPAPSQEQTTRQPFFSKTSAWEREEKERVRTLQVLIVVSLPD